MVISDNKKKVNLIIGVTVGIIIGLLTFNTFWILALLGSAILIIIAVISIKKIQYWVYSYLFCLILLPQFSISGIPIQSGDVIFLLGLFIFLFRFKKIKFNSIILSSMGFILIVLISVLSTLKFGSINLTILSAMNSLRLIEMIFPLFLLSTYNKTNFNVNKLTKYLIIISVITSLIGLYYFYLQIPLDDKTVWIGSTKFYRLAGVFYEANSFGQFTATIGLLITILLFKSNMLNLTRKNIVFLLICLMIIIFSGILTFSRSALLFYVIGLLIVIFMNFSIRNIISTLILLFSFFILVSLTQFKELVITRFSNTFANSFVDFNSVSGGRLDIWKSAILVIKNNLLFGVGYKNAPEVAAIYDNNYVTVLVETGIIGFILFIILLFSLLSLFRRNIKMKKFLGLYLFASTFAFIIQMLFLDSFTFWRTNTILFVLTGVTLAIKKDAKERRYSVDP